MGGLHPCSAPDCRALPSCFPLQTSVYPSVYPSTEHRERVCVPKLGHCEVVGETWLTVEQ